MLSFPYFIVNVRRIIISTYRNIHRSPIVHIIHLPKRVHSITKGYQKQRKAIIIVISEGSNSFPFTDVFWKSRNFVENEVDYVLSDN